MATRISGAFFRCGTSHGNRSIAYVVGPSAKSPPWRIRVLTEEFELFDFVPDDCQNSFAARFSLFDFHYAIISHLSKKSRDFIVWVICIIEPVSHTTIKYETKKKTEYHLDPHQRRISIHYRFCQMYGRRLYAFRSPKRWRKLRYDQAKNSRRKYIFRSFFQRSKIKTKMELCQQIGVYETSCKWIGSQF